jgi:hypothetical protein
MLHKIVICFGEQLRRQISTAVLISDDIHPPAQSDWRQLFSVSKRQHVSYLVLPLIEDAFLEDKLVGVKCTKCVTLTLRDLCGQYPAFFKEPR